MPTPMSELAEEVAGEFDGLIEELLDDFLGPSDDRLLMLVQKEYDNIPFDTMELVRTVLGHVDGEEKPCRVCELIAREEMKRSED